jgi:phosphopentomutase
MKRVIWLVLDSLGIGGAPDAARFGDEGADTLGHIAEWCARPLAAGGRGRPLALPHLTAFGLGECARLSTGRTPPGLSDGQSPRARHGVGREQSTGKDTISGHWEMAGLPVDFDWGYFREPVDSIPANLLTALAAECGVPGFLGNRHASGTQIIEELGGAHVASGKPIVYTSADSVLQIAAHEEHFGLERLYALCAAARRLVDPLHIGRVIARPFAGDDASGYARTPNRRDYAVPPTAPTVLERLVAAGGSVIGIGKISDIFAGRGISRAVKAHGISGLIEATLAAHADAGPGTLVYTNLVDFDQEYGHRRDIAGYAAALEDFDAMLPRLESALLPGDLLLLTADHGNDPSWHGSDHTREQVPIMAFGPDLAAGSIGVRDGFADMGQSLAHWFGLAPLSQGRSFL